jgi:hypothetical protein
MFSTDTTMTLFMLFWTTVSNATKRLALRNYLSASATTCWVSLPKNVEVAGSQISITISLSKRAACCETSHLYSTLTYNNISVRQTKSTYLRIGHNSEETFDSPWSLGCDNRFDVVFSFSSLLVVGRLRLGEALAQIALKFIYGLTHFKMQREANLITIYSAKK